MCISMYVNICMYLYLYTRMYYLVVIWGLPDHKPETLGLYGDLREVHHEMASSCKQFLQKQVPQL